MWCKKKKKRKVYEVTLRLSSCPGRALTFRKFPEKMDIGSKKMYLQEVCEGGQKNQGQVTFPRKSRAVVGDIRKNGQNFGDLNFHKI